MLEMLYSTSRRLRRGVGVFVALLMLASPVQAATPEQASQFITKLIDSAINNVIGAAIPQDQKEQRFRDLFVEAADIPSIAAFVVGREWRSASPEQKSHFIQLFEDVSILTWISHLDDYHGIEIKVTNAYIDKNTTFVESLAMLPEGKPVPIIWRVHEPTPGVLKLIDVTIEANSMLINTRKQYASVMKRDGGLDGLMASLEKMRTDLRSDKKSP